MSIVVENDQETVLEAAAILLKRMPASKVARLLSHWQDGRGDYTTERRKLFAGETVESLFTKARALEKRSRKR
jgi:hypothetical protein